MTDPTPVQAPSTEAVVAALAAALLPFAGPVGVAVSAVVPALAQLLHNFTAHSEADMSVADLEKIVTVDGRAALASLTAHVNALP